ncbi:IMP dehydrogenase [Hahella sp. CCB-MM4]|uniref:transglutaminase family protein n=1 Tax=Hahella sp. (strain CCB-MM4) TaxID=1926491 RepID=UPI000B9B6565|nr:transglutaminase family protein [Hahella sp. CCB-MM4]OZG74971.1 IMP dehydrogenase [Hahella sp. CCB-MM4]
MSIIVGLRHRTTYKFDRLVNLSPHTIRLRPAPHSRTPIISYSLKIQPETHFINWLQDPFSNYIARLVFPEKAAEFVVDVDLVADLTSYNPFDFFVEEYAEHYPFKYAEALNFQLAPFRETKTFGAKFEKYLKEFSRDKKPIVDFLVFVNQKICNDIKYNIRLEPGVQTPEETLDIGWGSCRDTSWLMVQVLRHMGLAARFVSGYLVQLSSDQKSLDGPSGPESDFTDLHAWCEVYVPGAGWLGLDPTSGLFAAEGHIPLSCTPDPTDAAPIVGALDPCEVEFSYSNEVTRLKEDPRVTKPFTEREWEDIDALGQYVDEILEQNDVRLTMGGEPTFVSIDDMESEQWNTDADGPQKRKLSFELAQKLKQRYAPKGFMHFGQGKWYPGEELPRWQYALYWRKDGQPIWEGPDDILDHNAKPEDARALMVAFSKQMGLSDKAILPCYEDPFYALWQNGHLPIDDKLDMDNENLAKRTLAQVLKQGLNNASGYCLPVGLNQVTQTWQTCLWKFRQGALYLVGGNSPIGLRLPLSSLSEHQLSDEFERHERDPFAPLPQELLPIHKSESRPLAGMAIHTALCTEVREGHLYAFMPPVSTLEEYVTILEAISHAAQEIDRPVRIEGYPPPHDPRLVKMVVAPDPGVIEVNVQPASSWDELKDIVENLYEDARNTRLGTEKFMIDGRHTGTGGGNHVTLGGATPTDSPLLRRPDLLRSLITFWQHHPSLSYLFSGTFIGPTSQAPRVDEARVERLYEMEIAFSQMPEGDVSQPWLVDRLLRHLLTDLTGNTHRSEFCIDKLYSPDSSTGRLGILEFRAFEMPPHSRMSLVQMLLLRTFVALFWNKPYKHKLTHWGTALHDRFMLPHFLWEDFKDVIRFLNENGFPFKEHWFEAFLEFRCPRIGRMELGGMHLELHHALEPWFVLGEEASGGGTARYVDSSMERLQVKLRLATPDRYALTCNGKRIPLVATEEEGCYVAGIRYRAWQPWSALHPTIGVHSPLVFDLFDTWNGRSLGGCTYHVVHPGGRSYEQFPVNPLEAEARRINRFEDIGHQHGTRIAQPIVEGGGRFYPGAEPRKGAVPSPTPVNPSYPTTLDLRYD